MSIRVFAMISCLIVGSGAVNGCACLGDDDDSAGPTLGWVHVTGDDDDTGSSGDDDTTIGDDDSTSGDDDTGDDDVAPLTFVACAMPSDCVAPQVCRMVYGRGMICVDECRADGDCCVDPRVDCGKRCEDLICVAATPETCNGIDDDRDGTVDEDADFTDPATCGSCTHDCTALPHVASATCADGTCATVACDDGFFNHNATTADGCEYACTFRGDETPNGVDDDCDGAVDEDFPCRFESERRCGSGTGICEEGTQSCIGGMWTDCADAVGPQPEVCDGVDNDCDGDADNGFDLTSDDANCGACGVSCDAAFSEATATCASGACVFSACLDGALDYDEDVTNGCLRCDVSPTTAEVCDRTLRDENCDGVANEDCDCFDGEQRACGLDDLALHGVGECHFGFEACNGGAWGICEGAKAKEDESCDGRDNDCDGSVPADEADADRDGYAACAGDCNDADWLVHPLPLAVVAAGGSIETCNDVDDDCDGATDEHLAIGNACGGTVGACSGKIGVFECASMTKRRCSVDKGGSAFAGSAEVANGLDDDCDGAVDEGFACPAGMTRFCGPEAPVCDWETGACLGACVRLGVQRCEDSGVWGACAGATFPTLEACDGVDNDCDDIVPDDESDADGDDVRVCAGDTADSDASVFPGAPETCNGVDDDLDGNTDEDFGVGLACNRNGANACDVGVRECRGLDDRQCSTLPGGSAYAGTVESCDRVDNDCNGIVDDVTSSVVASDADNCGGCGNDCRFASGSGACVAGTCTLAACNVGFVDADGDSATGCEYRCTPSGDEACDDAFTDEDCDGSRNEGCTCPDGTYRPCGPDAPICDLDDGECRGVCTLGTQRCDGGVWSACNGAQYPESVEACNGLDDDCSGGIPNAERDSDGDGIMGCAGDCDDGDPTINPNADDVCDGVNNDCSGMSDDRFAIGVACNLGGVNACGVGAWECAPDGTARCSTLPGGSAFPSIPEACDNRVDDDCDGDVDEPDVCGACRPGEQDPCGLANTSINGIGQCVAGIMTCTPARTWGTCVGARDVATDVCDGDDNDCDGDSDEDFDLDTDAGNCGACGNDCLDLPNVTGASCVDGACAISACHAGFVNLDGSPAGGCEYACHVTNGGMEQCDRLDNDCDGAVDEGFDFSSDEDHCGGCGNECRFASGSGACAFGTCTLVACNSGFVDADGDPATGCEYRCTPTADPTDGPAVQCDRLDNNCDGAVDEGCLCETGDRQPCGLDPALDRVGLCDEGVQDCVSGAWTMCFNVVAPVAEVCDGDDNDCDGDSDEDFDLDTDAGNCGACGNDCAQALFVSAASCVAGACMVDTCIAGHVDLDVRGANGCEYSCTPSNGGVEQCDRLDNNCNGAVDEGFNLDTDPENCGSCGVVCAIPNTTMACAEGACVPTGCESGYMLVSGSCLRCDAFPPAVEVCDAAFLDEDCDGVRNEGCTCSNGTTQSCGVDPALNGVGQCLTGTQTCIAGVWSACVGVRAPSSEVCDRVDNDCVDALPASETDGDGDGFAPCEGDCDDGDVTQFPGADEICNGADDDCDGVPDDGFGIGQACNVNSANACGQGVYECALDGTQRCSTMSGGTADGSVAEACDDLRDNDCDGIVDEDCAACAPGDETVCGNTATHLVGECHVGYAVCGGDRQYGACIGATDSTSESCDGADNDCDGVVDEDYDLGTDPEHCGMCEFGLDDLFFGGFVIAADCVGGMFTNIVCFPGYHDVDVDPLTCEYGCFPTLGGTEVDNCDGVDNDCNGVIDDDPSCSPPPVDFDAFTFSVTLMDTPSCEFDGTARLDGTVLDRMYTLDISPLTVVGRTLTASGIGVTGWHQLDLCLTNCDMPSIATYAVFRDGTTGMIVECGTPALTFAGSAVSQTAVPNTSGGGTWATDAFTVP